MLFFHIIIRLTSTFSPLALAPPPLLALEHPTATVTATAPTATSLKAPDSRSDRLSSCPHPSPSQSPAWPWPPSSRRPDHGEPKMALDMNETGQVFPFFRSFYSSLYSLFLHCAHGSVGAGFEYGFCFSFCTTSTLSLFSPFSLFLFSL